MFFMAKVMVKPLVRSVNKVHDGNEGDSLKTLIPIEVIRFLKLQDKEKLLWEYDEGHRRMIVSKYIGRSKP
jgi:hypothetical protein